MGGTIRIEPAKREQYVILDSAMGHRVPITGIDSSPQRVDTDVVPAPVSDAWAFETRRLEFSSAAMMLRNEDGDLVSENVSDPVSWDGEALIELDLGCKVYLAVTGTVRLRNSAESAVVAFESSTRVTLGARSYQTAPAGTVTTTPDPDGLAWAISHFGGAVMTTAPERSFPTLRGHPPQVELDEERDYDGTVSVPDSDVHLAVAPQIDAILEAAPLAYYLATPLRLSSEPHLEAAGERVSLADDADRSVENLLAHLFVCDVAARQHGYYDIQIREGQAVEHLLDFAALYDASHAERVGAYLTAPLAETLPHAPDWSTVAHVDPVPSSLEHLPALVADLAPVRPGPPETYTGDEARAVALDRFVTSAPTRGTAEVFDGREAFVDIPETDGSTDVWVGDGIPLNAGKSLRAGYEHARSASDADSVRVLVVCNDSSMGEEAIAARRNYRRRDDLPFEVELREGVSVDRLRELLARDSDLFHFVGHATEAGLECPDGYLDTTTVESVGTTAFLLNACQSYPHAVELVERGAAGGLVTLADVGNETALSTGRLVARMLSRGYPLGVSRTLLRRAERIAGVYTIIGDPNTSIGQAVDVCTVNTIQKYGSEYELSERRIPSRQFGLGTLVGSAVLDSVAVLVGTKPTRQQLSEPELIDVLNSEDMPLFIDDELHWSGDIGPEGLP